MKISEPHYSVSMSEAVSSAATRAGRPSSFRSRRAMLIALGAVSLAGLGALFVRPERRLVAPLTTKPFRCGASTVLNPDLHHFQPLAGGAFLVLGSDGVVLRYDPRTDRVDQCPTPTEATLSAALLLDTNLWIFSGAGGCLLRTRDSGNSFEPVQSGVQAHLRALVRDPRGVLAVGDGGAAAFGTLDGATWRPLSLGAHSDLGHALAVGDRWVLIAGSGGCVLRGDAVTGFREDVVDEGASVTCAAALSGGVALVGTEAGAIHVATSETSTLTRVVLGSPDDFPSAIGVTADGRGCVVATSRGHLHFTEDAGRSFRSLTLGQREYISAVSFARDRGAFWAVSTSGTAYPGSPETGLPTGRSSGDVSLQAVLAVDAGRAWAAGRGGGLVRLQSAAAAEVVHPAITSYLNGIALEPERGVLVAAGRDSTVVRSTNGGLDWQVITVSVASATTFFGVSANARGAVFVYGSGGALLRSDDGGLTFESVSATSNAVAAMLVTPASAIAFAIDDGPWWSRDDGRTFQRAHTSRPVTLTHAIAGLTPTDVLALGPRGQVALSDDGGRTFRLIQLDAEVDLESALALPGDGRLLLSGTKGAVYASRDGGRSFARQSHAGPAIRALAWHDATSSVFGFGKHGAVLRSRDRGSSFEALPPVVDGDLRSVTAMPDGGLLAFGAGGAAMRITPDGSLEPVFTHSRAGFSAAAFARDASALVLVGGRIARIENALA